MTRPLTDQEILSILRGDDAGDPIAAAEEWCRRFDERARGVAKAALRRRSLPIDLFEDVVQQAHFNIFTHLDRLDLHRSPWPYCLTIVKHVVMDLARQASRQSQIMRGLRERLSAVIPEKEAGAEDGVAEVLNAISSECREMMEAHYLHGQSAREIAAQGIEEARVYRLLHRGRCQARETLRGRRAS